MRTLAAIRTHHWGEDARRLHAQLAPVFGEDLVVVFHNRPADLELPLPVIDINDDWVAGQGLRLSPDWGWRCGDYFLYALRAARRDADFFWVIEPDVYFSADPAPLFARLAGAGHDALGVQVEALAADHEFMRRFPGRQLHRAIFAFTRWSAPVLDWLFDLRRQDGAQLDIAGKLMNDECFCFTNLIEQDSFSLAEIAELVPDLVNPSTILTDPDILVEMVREDVGAIVHHPVRNRSGLIDIMARRIVRRARANPIKLVALPSLSETDVHDLCNAVARHLETSLLETRTQMIRHNRRIARQNRSPHHA
ncbi:MAG: hypothetical protein FJX19_09815 [Alphaproteobacteria bacterium]|nr:hypothetical protein [Alphaproteobacteria bacterium]